MNDAKRLFSNSAIIFLGTFVGSVFSYLFNMLMGRMLGPEQYGEMTALMSLIMIGSVASGAVLTVTMKYASDLFHSDQIESLKKLFSKFSVYMVIFGLLLFLLGLVFTDFIASFFSINNSAPIFIALSGFFFGYMIVVSRGILQGTQNFVALSLTSALEMILKFVVGIFLVKLGFSINGALGGIVLATAITYFVILIPLIRILTKNKNKEIKANESFTFNKQEILKYTLPVLISTLLLTISMNIDVVLIKHLFEPEEAGLYAAVSTVAKIILFITGPIISVMFPMISEKKAKGDKHYRIFFFSILITLFGGLLILGAYIVMPATVLNILYGSEYTKLYYLLPEIGLAILFYSLINLLANYFLAVKNYWFIIFYILISVTQIIWIFEVHPSLQYVVRILIATFGLLFFIMMSYYFYTKRAQLISFFRGEYAEETKTLDSNSSI